MQKLPPLLLELVEASHLRLQQHLEEERRDHQLEDNKLQLHSRERQQLRMHRQTKLVLKTHRQLQLHLLQQPSNSKLEAAIGL